AFIALTRWRACVLDRKTRRDGACNGGGSAGEACLTRANRRGGDAGRIHSGRAGVPRGRPASPAPCRRGGDGGRIHSGRLQTCTSSRRPNAACNGGGSAGEACLTRALRRRRHGGASQHLVSRLSRLPAAASTRPEPPVA